ncbi:hypothetical protein FISHEDRAFT_62775 [Fistulina hepatica ATCC 64428]|nr:hypothetical protein FISHEDRAFT_62775 [Fistulina hepatica ATCC 64428]
MVCLFSPPSTTSLTLCLNDLNINEGPISVTADEKLQDINEVAAMLAMIIGPKDPDPYHPEGPSQGYNISGQRPLLTFHWFSIRTLKNITDVLPLDLDSDNEAGFIDVPTITTGSPAFLHLHILVNHLPLTPSTSDTPLKAAVIHKHVASAHMDFLSVRKVSVVDLHVTKSRWMGAAIPKYVVPPGKKMVLIWWDEVTPHPTDSSWSVVRQTRSDDVANAQIVQDLCEVQPFTQLSGFVNTMFAAYFPNQELLHHYSTTVFTASTFNMGSHTVSLHH